MRKEVMIRRFWSRMKKITLLLGFLIIFTFLVSCTSNVPSEKQCTSDSDCVPDSCCHAKSAVNKEHSPKCNGIMCTMDCQPETLDCSQGEVKCIENSCSVVFN